MTKKGKESSLNTIPEKYASVIDGMTLGVGNMLRNSIQGANSLEAITEKIKLRVIIPCLLCGTEIRGETEDEVYEDLFEHLDEIHQEFELPSILMRKRAKMVADML